MSLYKNIVSFPYDGSTALLTFLEKFENKL